MNRLEEVLKLFDLKVEQEYKNYETLKILKVVIKT